MSKRDWIDQMFARNEKQARYDADHTKRVNLKLNLKTDADIIEWLSKQESMQGSIKELIRKRIAEEQNSNVLGYWSVQTQATPAEAKEIEEVIKECEGDDSPVIPDYMRKHKVLKALAKTDRKKFDEIADYINDRLFGK